MSGEGSRKMREGTRSPRRTVAAAVALCLLAHCGPGVVAAEVGLSASLGVGHTDNLEQSERQLGATFGIAQAAASIESLTRTLETDVNAQVTRYEFSTAEFEDYTRVAGRGELTWMPLPERFEWRLEGMSGQADSTAISSLSRRASGNATYVSTGPLFKQQLAGGNELLLSGERSVSDIGYGYDLHSTTTRGNLELAHELTPLRRVFIGARYRESVEESSGLEQRYDVKSAYLGLRSVARRLALSVTGSAEQLDSGASRDSRLGYDITLQQLVGARSRVFAGASRGWRDASDVFVSSMDGTGLPDGTRYVPNLGSVFEYEDVRLGVAWSSRSADAMFTVSRSEEQLRRRTNVGLSLRFQLSSSSELNAALYHGHQDGTALGSNTSGNDDSATLRYSLLLTPRLQMALEGTHLRSRLSGLSFHENRIGLTFQYAFQALTPRARRAYFDRAFERDVESIRGIPAESDSPE